MDSRTASLQACSTSHFHSLRFFMETCIFSQYAIHWLCITTLLGAVAAAFFWACAGLHSRRRELQPPGPIGLPIIGHLHLLGSLPHRSLARLSKVYGPLMSLRLGSMPLLVASSPEAAKLILHTHDKIFLGRPTNFCVIKIAFNAMDMAFCPPGPYWRLLRQLFYTEFFSAKRLQHFQPMRDDEVRSLLGCVLAAQGTPISIREKLHATNSNLISKMTLGTRLQELGAAASTSVPSLLELFGMIAVFNVSDFMPWLAWMDLQGLGRRSKKAARIATHLFQEAIDKRRASCRSPDELPRDFLDVLLMVSRDPKHAHLGIGDEHIRALIMDMFVGGTDSSALTIEWALLELLYNKKKMIILEQEIERVVGCSCLVQESDLPNLPYLQAVVNETFRLHPITPLLSIRVSMEPCQISKYFIPKNTLAHVNVWAIHRDPNIWSDPLEFCPERFLDSNIDELNQQCKFLPFGAGRRSCPGSKLGLLTVQRILGNLIHTFDWKTNLKPHMKEKYALISGLEDPLIVVPTPKSLRPPFEVTL